MPSSAKFAIMHQLITAENKISRAATDGLTLDEEKWESTHSMDLRTAYQGRSLFFLFLISSGCLLGLLSIFDCAHKTAWRAIFNFTCALLPLTLYCSIIALVYNPSKDRHLLRIFYVIGWIIGICISIALEQETRSKHGALYLLATIHFFYQYCSLHSGMAGWPLRCIDTRGAWYTRTLLTAEA